MIGRQEIDDRICDVLRTLLSIKTQVTPLSCARVEAAIVTLEGIRAENAKALVMRCLCVNVAVMRPSQCLLSDGHAGDCEWGAL